MKINDILKESDDSQRMTPNWAKYVMDQLINSEGEITLTDLFDEGIPGLRAMFMATAEEHGLDPEEDFQDVEHEVILKLNDIIHGGHGLDEGEVEMPTGQATGIDSQTDTPPSRSFSIKVVGNFIPSSSQTFTATQLFNALTSILPRDYPYVAWENQKGSPQRRVIDDINNDGFSIVKQGINSQDVAETIASKFEAKGIPAEVIDGGIYEEQLNEFLPALAAGAGALARGATVAGGAALKGAQALGGAAIKGVQAVAPGIVKGVQAVAPGVVKTGQAIGKVPGQIEKGLIKGVEMLDALVPGGIFNPDGSMKGSQYLTKYLTPQQIQQAQQQSAQNQQQGLEEAYDPAQASKYISAATKAATIIFNATRGWNDKFRSELAHQYGFDPDSPGKIFNDHEHYALIDWLKSKGCKLSYNRNSPINFSLSMPDQSAPYEFNILDMIQNGEVNESSAVTNKKPEADYGDDYQDMVKRLKHLAGAGPLKTVYDPAKRVYKNVPTAQQPKK